MSNAFSRTERLLGKDAMQLLARSRVAVFGLGGVGGYVVEALARSGVGALDVIDSDTVDVTNINRQILATHTTLGRYKTDVAAERIADINPACAVRAHRLFYLPDTADQLELRDYDYIVDAIDTVTAKLTLIERARDAGTPIISVMGTGNKCDPTALEVTDISKTSFCPLARIMRKELRARGIHSLKVVFSREPAKAPLEPDENAEQPSEGRRQIPGSTAFLPSVAGLIAAGEVVRDLTEKRAALPKR